MYYRFGPYFEADCQNEDYLKQVQAEDAWQQQFQARQWAKRRKLGTVFFYYHQTCGQWRDAAEYEQILINDCAPDTMCCGCWGLLHEAPRTEE